MKVLLLTHGTRGDIQPFVALAHALGCAGHDVTLAAPASAAPLARPFDVKFYRLSDPRIELADDPDARAVLQASTLRLPARVFSGAATRKARSVMRDSLDDMATAAEPGTQVVVYPPIIPGHAIAEHLGVPAVPACLNPTRVPTRGLTNPMLSFRVPRALNRVSYLPTNLSAWRQFGNVSQWRRDTLGLPDRRGGRNFLRRPDGTPATVLNAFSRHLLPDSVTYPPWVHTTGFWFLPTPTEWAPSTDLEAFLSTGPPPVYIGFGSMIRTDARRNARLVNAAVGKTGVRAVVVGGWGGIEATECHDDIFFLDEAPLGWLFSRVAAVVHHGGTGTTAAALASGRPQVVCPFMAIHHYYARVLHAAGVAPPPLPQRRVNADGLADAIRSATTDRFRAQRARYFERATRAERGVARAVEVLEALT